MTEGQGAVAEPFFLQGAAGRLYAMYYPPAVSATRDQAVLLIPPFAEEMNKSRHMYALMARRLSAIGYAVLHIDLHGTGDSEGDFGDARWDTWVADLGRALRWLGERGHKTSHFVALRLGALLALDLIESEPMQAARLVLWQPVLRGETYITQFLRLRLASSMMDSAREKESTDDLRRMLRAGEPIEVAGYLLAPELAAAIERKSFAVATGSRIGSMHWFDVASGERPLSPASVKAIEGCRSAGIAVTASTIVGQPFWSTIEIAFVPALLDATAALFTEGHVDAA